MAQAVFKILRPNEAAKAMRQRDGTFAGNALDRQDGFIHLSYSHQIAGTLERHFADVDEVVLLRIDPNALPPGALRAEPSRGGALFPHLHAPLPRQAVVRQFSLRRGTDGSFIIPDSLDAEPV